MESATSLLEVSTGTKYVFQCVAHLNYNVNDVHSGHYALLHFILTKSFSLSQVTWMEVGVNGVPGLMQFLVVQKGVEEGRRQKPGPGFVTTQVPGGMEQTVLGSPDNFKIMEPATLRTVFVQQVSLEQRRARLALSS